MAAAAAVPAFALNPPPSLFSNFISSIRTARTSAPLWRRTLQRRHRHSQQQEVVCRAYKVELEHRGEVHTLEVEEGETILEKALDADLDVPYDCKLGVCMTCPAKLVSGSVDQSGGMLSDDVIEKGYALLCMAVPQSNCRFRTIPEDELLALQLVTAQH